MLAFSRALYNKHKLSLYTYNGPTREELGKLVRTGLSLVTEDILPKNISQDDIKAKIIKKINTLSAEKTRIINN